MMSPIRKRGVLLVESGAALATDDELLTISKLIETGQYGAALPHLETLAAKGLWEVYSLIGDMHYFGGRDLPRDATNAIASYRRAIFEGDDPHAHMALGRALLEQGSPSLAEVHLRTAHRRLEPGANLLLGQCLIESPASTSLEEAEGLLTVAAKEGYVMATAYLGQIYRRRGNTWKAAVSNLRMIYLVFRMARSNPESPLLEGAYPLERTPGSARPRRLLRLVKPSRGGLPSAKEK